MTHTFCALLAAGALGAPGEPACSCGASPTPAGPYVQATAAGQGGVRGWLRYHLGLRQSSGTNRTAMPDQVITAEPARIQPTVFATVTPGTVTISNRIAPTATPVPSAAPPVTTTPQAALNVSALRVDAKYEDRIGHEKDYSWVTGHLYYIHAEGGRWVVRYALPDELDKYGGGMVLAPGVEMRNYREGDLVCVYGDVLDEGRTSRALGGALYRVNVISLVDRADP